jgi:hypothetical protein
MTNKNIKSALQDALKEKIPSSQVELWPAVRASLVARRHQFLQKGEPMHMKRSSRLLRLAIPGLVIMAFLITALLTTQGRSFAQSLLQFFTRAEETTFELGPSQVVPDGVELAPTAQAPAPLISVAEAESQVGFKLAELPTVPDGFEYLGARLYGNAVNIEYQTQGRGGHLSIMQSQEGYLQSDWDKVPAEAIIPVKIGEMDGELVQGTFVVYAGESSAVWEPNAAMLRLRWFAGGTWFEMTKSGNVETIEYLDKTRMIELAESLTIQR